MAQIGGLSGRAKLDAVTDLLGKLNLDLEKHDLVPKDRDAALEELKVYGRDPRNSDPIFTNDGIKTLSRHAFESDSPTTSRNALRVLANALFLRPECRQVFADLGYGPTACQKLESDSIDDEFLFSRVLLLSIYNLDFNKMLDETTLAVSMTRNVSRHATRLSSSSKAKTDPIEEMALKDTLSLLQGITSRCSTRKNLFTGAIPGLVSMLLAVPPGISKPLDPPLGLVVNALSNLDLGDEEVHPSLFPKDEASSPSAKLISLLELSTKAYKDKELEVQLTPLTGILIDLYAVAPDDVRKVMRDAILPTEEDRKGVLGQGSSPSARLLRNTINPMAPGLSMALSNLLYDLSDRNATTFVDNIGYGYASGYLFQNKIPVPPGATAAKDGGKAVNPITGQLLELETGPDLPEMTEEEKEREAERLFVLFERLKRTGVVNVQNPVEKAYQEGRLKELDDDAEDVD